MPTITRVRPILLSAPYADTETNLEVLHHLTSGYRTTGMVEITLEDGTTGLGEGYLAVFAPAVFVEMVKLVTPVLIGRDVADHVQILRDLQMTTGYWSLQGAAQHVNSAVEIALCDCRAKLAGVPVYRLFSDAPNTRLKLYASGGDSLHPQAMETEFQQVKALGIDTLKIRARRQQVNKARWCIQRGAQDGVRIAIDMAQNLAVPSQNLEDVRTFLDALGNPKLAFIEEALGPDVVEDFVALRRDMRIPVAGGEIVTTPRELEARLRDGYYDIVQPDATVIGGISPVISLFAPARATGAQVYVHAWGGPVGMLANYHAAAAGGGGTVEWPMPRYPLRDALLVQPWRITGGVLTLPDVPGLGVQLTPEIERAYSFREDSVYQCMVRQNRVLPDEVWA
jgi:L-alanine-DL-glutamate epimerase-like enolase superfamily enzyme